MVFAPTAHSEYYLPTGCFVASPAALPRILRNAPLSQPPAFNRAFSFSNFQAANPSLPTPGSQVDGELNNAQASIDGICTNLALIQRDDGALKNGAVTFDTLSSSLQTAGLTPALPWVTGTAYAANASVTHGSAFYRAPTAHTSGTFATDLAAGKWVLIVDFATIALVAAAMIAVTPSGVLTTDVQGSLQALDTGKAPLSHTQVASTISDSTAAGRALLTAADVATQQGLLQVSTLGFQPGDIKETACPVLQSGWYYADGSNKNRTTDAALFAAITISQNGTLVSGSAVVTALTDTSNMSPGMPVSNTGGLVPAATVIQSVDSATQVTMSANATGSSTVAGVRTLWCRRRFDHLWPAQSCLRRGRPRQRKWISGQRAAGLDHVQHHQWHRGGDRGLRHRSFRRHVRFRAENTEWDQDQRDFRHRGHAVGERDRQRRLRRHPLLACARRADVGFDRRCAIELDDACHRQSAGLHADRNDYGRRDHHHVKRHSRLDWNECGCTSRWSIVPS